MCSGMVVFMTLYNLFTNGLLGTITLPEILFQLILGFITAFLLELFIVGPVAKKLAFSLPYDKSKQVLVVVFMALFMVTGMVLFMSFYGLGMSYLSNHWKGEAFFDTYLTLVLKNFAFALPLQLLIVGPLVRYVFVHFVKEKGISVSVGNNENMVN
jgi:hypothetical protein